MTGVSLSRSQISWWSRAADIVCVMFPAVILIPMTVLGSVFASLFASDMLKDGFAGLGIALLPLAVLLGILGWSALFTAVSRRWRGVLAPSWHLKLGLMSGVLASLYPNVEFWGERISLSADSPKTWSAEVLSALPYGFVLIAPAVMCVVYLYALSSGGRT